MGNFDFGAKGCQLKTFSGKAKVSVGDATMVLRGSCSWRVGARQQLGEVFWTNIFHQKIQFRSQVVLLKFGLNLPNSFSWGRKKESCFGSNKRQH